MKFLHLSAFTCCLFVWSASGLPSRAESVPRDSKNLSGPMILDEYEDLLKTINSLLNQKKYDEALANCQKAIQMRPNDFRPQELLGVAYAAQNDLKSSSEAYAQAIARAPGDKYLYLSKARADWYRNARAEAIESCRQALKIDPDLTEAYLMIGEILQYDKDRKEEAFDAYRAALKSSPNNPVVYVSYGKALQSSGDSEKAEAYFRRSMELDPKKMAGRFELGRIRTKQGRLTEARELWEGRTSDEERTFPKFITVLERAERLKKATDELTARPNDPAALVKMGKATMDNDSWVIDGRQEKAIFYFKVALSIRPDLVDAQFEICKAYVEIADNFKDKNKNVNEELIKLRTMDPMRAKEIDEYRKTFQGSIRGVAMSSNR